MRIIIDKPESIVPGEMIEIKDQDGYNCTLHLIMSNGQIVGKLLIDGEIYQESVPRAESKTGNFEPAVMLCFCGESLELADSLTNYCDECGRAYNSSGQSLRPPDEWEERYDDDY